MWPGRKQKESFGDFRVKAGNFRQVVFRESRKIQSGGCRESRKIKSGDLKESRMMQTCGLTESRKNL